MFTLSGAPIVSLLIQILYICPFHYLRSSLCYCMLIFDLMRIIYIYKAHIITLFPWLVVASSVAIHICG